ncbi:MAG: hypothetical protein ACREM6_00990 [Vulcanimicrobiaceae bacterium]
MNIGLHIGIVCPSEASARSGNRVTADRWRRILMSLGHRAVTTRRYDGRPFDVLVVLHARKGAAAAAEFRAKHPDRALIVALTGTDIYGRDDADRSMLRTLESADRLIALQAAAPQRIAPHLRAKTAIIYQSASPP